CIVINPHPPPDGVRLSEIKASHRLIDYGNSGGGGRILWANVTPHHQRSTNGGKVAWAGPIVVSLPVFLSRRNVSFDFYVIAGITAAEQPVLGHRYTLHARQRSQTPYDLIGKTHDLLSPETGSNRICPYQK